MAKAKVLLVDDEEDFTATLSERLETRGLDVDVSSNGADAQPSGPGCTWAPGGTASSECSTSR